MPFDRLDEDGRAVGAAGGLEVHVIGGLPGETAEVRVDHRSPHGARAWGTFLGLAGPAAPDRVAPACPGHGRCGGCILQHQAYAAQLAAKRDRLRAALARHASLAGLEPAAVVPSPLVTGYRNKAKYVLGAAGGRLMLGSYAPGTHDVVDMTGCRVPEPAAQAVAEDLALRLADAGVRVYDERARTGELRYLVVRANHEGRVLAVIVSRTDGPRAALTATAALLRAARPEVAGVVLNVNPTTGGAIFGPDEHVLAGESALPDRIGAIALHLSARAFFQVNRAQAGRLYARAAEAAGAAPGRRIADLYTGVGGIALTMAARGANVVGIETHAPAVADARRSASTAGLEARARFEAADAAAGLATARSLLGTLDAVVVNPPRRGLHPAARAALVAARPSALVYVSCGPESLAGDLAALHAAGWRTESLEPYDLLPGTPHVETLAVLASS